MEHRPVNTIQGHNNTIKVNDLSSQIKLIVKDGNDKTVSLENKIEYFYLYKDNKKFFTVDDIEFTDDGLLFRIPPLRRGLYKIEIKDTDGHIYPAGDDVEILLIESFEGGKEAKFITMKDSVLKDVPEIVINYMEENPEKFKGDKGDKGDKGEQGEKGEQGIKGDRGFKGEKGEKGDKGDKGEQGEQGIKGDRGDKGEKGEKGEKGDKGEQGIKGDRGVKGEKGEKGDKGDKGEQGIKGDRGFKGEKGEKGDKGDKGEQGEQGIKGERGVKGEKGEKGDKGDKGEQGEQGEQGPAGEDGARGPKGDRGDRGPQGPKGEQVEQAYLHALLRGDITGLQAAPTDVRIATVDSTLTVDENNNVLLDPGVWAIHLNVYMSPINYDSSAFVSIFHNGNQVSLLSLYGDSQKRGSLSHVMKVKKGDNVSIKAYKTSSGGDVSFGATANNTINIYKVGV